MSAEILSIDSNRGQIGFDANMVGAVDRVLWQSPQTFAAKLSIDVQRMNGRNCCFIAQPRSEGVIELGCMACDRSAECFQQSVNDVIEVMRDTEVVDAEITEMAEKIIGRGRSDHESAYTAARNKVRSPATVVELARNRRRANIRVKPDSNYL